MSNTIKLNYTAEQINDRLGLIEANKNLLEYPYDESYYNNLQAADLIDVGDGSILTKAGTKGTDSTLFLNKCTLIGGKKYIISLNITNILEEVVNNSQFSLKIECSNDTSLNKDAIYSYTTIDLSGKEAATSIPVLVYVNIPATFEANLLIKPQIELQPIIDGNPSESPSHWVPNMDKIGTYVDRRFNGTNAKLRDVRAFMDLIEIVDA